MAQRRMFSKSITRTAKFLQMPISTRLLYYDLGMEADDDGFVESFSILRMTNASEDDLRLLEAKGYIKIINDELTAYITDWKINNQIRKDRHTPSIYSSYLKNLCGNQMATDGKPCGNQMATDGKPCGNQMATDGKPCGNQMATDGKPCGNQMATQVSIGKISLDQDRVGEYNSCDEESFSQEEIEILFSLPLNDKTMYDISNIQIEEWKYLYPIVDIMQELRNMYGWLDANPSKRKTRTGIKKFINSWLAKAQNNGGYSFKPNYQQNYQNPNRNIFSEILREEYGEE